MAVAMDIDNEQPYMRHQHVPPMPTKRNETKKQLLKHKQTNATKHGKTCSENPVGWVAKRNPGFLKALRTLTHRNPVLGGLWGLHGIFCGQDKTVQSRTRGPPVGSHSLTGLGVA